MADSDQKPSAPRSVMRDWVLPLLTPAVTLIALVVWPQMIGWFDWKNNVDTSLTNINGRISVLEQKMTGQIEFLNEKVVGLQSSVTDMNGDIDKLLQYHLMP